MKTFVFIANLNQNYVEFRAQNDILYPSGCYFKNLYNLLLCWRMDFLTVGRIEIGFEMG